ncbi:MAG: hypothetical protein IPI67_19230 [Myxococcales bacterium]|nr:hypothetical protein [Myxococcales bacterium]
MTRFAALLVLIPLVTACSKNADHPESVSVQCDGGKCVGPGPGGGGGAKGDGGLEAGSNDATVDAPTGVDVTGSVVLLTGDDFLTAVPFAEQASVGFEGADGAPVEGSYSGASFVVAGVAEGQGVWATVTPNNLATLPTLQPTDTTQPPLELAVVPATTIDTIYGFLSVPEQRVKGAAHVVLRFVDAKTGVPVTGVTVTHKGEIVTYDTGGSWSDTAPGTGVGGYAVVVNVTSAKLPNKQNFQFNAGTSSGGVYVLLQPDSVTLADVLVN